MVIRPPLETPLGVPGSTEQVERLVVATGVDYVIGCLAWGDLTLARSLRSLRLYADEVMPAFR